VDFIQLDTGNYESIKNAADEFAKFNMKLDVLVNNAAILLDKVNILKTPYETLTETLLFTCATIICLYVNIITPSFVRKINPLLKQLLPRRLHVLSITY